MKRFILFAYADAAGGMDDAIGDYDTAQNAWAAALDGGANREDCRVFDRILGAEQAAPDGDWNNPMNGEAVLQRADVVPLSVVERDTILAALRYWQNLLVTGSGRLREGQLSDLIQIAEDTGEKLAPDEIDELCERINV